MSWFRQLRYQANFDLLMFRRNPAATFFTIIFPLIFLFLFTSIFGNEETNDGVRVATFYVPGILALAIISATFVNPAMNMVTRRERGTLKRVRGTPLRPWVFVAAQVLAAAAISIFMTVLVVTIGWAVFDVSLNSRGVGSLILTVLIGSMAMSALGLALTSIIPSESAAPAITNAIVLPLYFISDVFIVGDKPEILETIANLFPIQHLASALFESFDPFVTTVPWPVTHWLVIAAWGVFGAIATLVTFRWIPRR
ncbi:MAG: ABC transporter permease [Actinomycetia bacterium]|nr:ABC transporter permease [Actinomycetes bacterium]